MANKRIQTTELDFDGIKQNLKTYLQGQEQFSDYDFEGSGLSILLDVLAYNTHYNALYQNLAINEAFLDSASKRSSVVSKAKELGYVPQSAKSATAVVNVVMINNQINAPQTLEIPRFTPFNTTINDQQFVFYTVDSHLAYRQDNQYVFSNITLKEGEQLVYRFTVENGSEFALPNPGVDISTLRVTVQENAESSTYETYTHSSTLLNIDGTSLVYFVKELDNNFHQIEFGNGVVGKKLEVGNIVTVEYIVCNEDRPNGASTFQYNGGLATNTQAFVTTDTPAFGGSAPEDVDNIKWNAPRTFAAQNRCVTLDDYKTIVYSLYPNARSINVWGGEQNVPPSYGDVFISIKPESSETLSDGEKEFLLNEVIGPRRIVTVRPKLVDPQYLDIELNVSFYYNNQNTNRQAGDIAALIRQTIEAYNEQELNKFGGILKYSALSRQIDQSEPSITSSITTLRLHREIQPRFNTLSQYVVDIGNPIYNSGVPEDSIISTGINVLNIAQIAYIDDIPTEGNSIGQLRLFYYESGRKVVIRNVGTVNYNTGLITINDLIITGIPQDSFKLVIKPQSNDVVSVRNQIASIAPQLVTITPVVDKTADNYSFTSSRN